MTELIVPRAESRARPPIPRGPHLLGAKGAVAFAVVLAASGVASLVASISIGAVGLPPADVWRVVAAHVVPGQHAALDPVDDQIVWTLRAPRALLALVVGGGLAVSGAALQALVRNPLADPYVLGVASGASLGAVAVLALGSAALAGLSLSAAAFVGAIASMLLVFALARRGGIYSPGRVILAGVAIGYAASAATSFLQFQVDAQQLQGIIFWLLGSLAGAQWSDLGIPAAAVVLSSGWLTLQGRRLNALAVGEESAVALGVDVRRFRVQLMVVSSVLVGAVIAVAGGIGFVGLVIPHVVRLLVGPDHRRLLPLTALLGGVFLVWVDVLARVVSSPSELPIGIFTAGIGAPFFLWLMRRANRVEGGA